MPLLATTEVKSTSNLIRIAPTSSDLPIYGTISSLLTSVGEAMGSGEKKRGSQERDSGGATGIEG
jgi:hypothetical protein